MALVPDALPPTPTSTPHLDISPDPISSPLETVAVSAHADRSPSAIGLAPRRDVASWALVSLFITFIMLFVVWIAAIVWGAADVQSGQSSSLLRRNHRFIDMQAILSRNVLVLAIHFMACYLGAIIGRPHEPAPARFGRIGQVLHRETPEWMKRLALLYALTATLLSVLVQSTGLGLSLNDISAAADLPRHVMLLLTLPHAIPELVAVFLPLGLFLLAARSGRLRELGVWSWQSLSYAVPIIVAAAAIETYVSPLIARAVVFS